MLKRRPVRQPSTILTSTGHVSSIRPPWEYLFFIVRPPSTKNWSVILRFKRCLPPFVPLALSDGYHNWREGRQVGEVSAPPERWWWAWTRDQITPVASPPNSTSVPTFYNTLDNCYSFFTAVIWHWPCSVNSNDSWITRQTEPWSALVSDRCKKKITTTTLWCKAFIASNGINIQ